MPGWKQLCFTDGETIHAEGGEVDVFVRWIDIGLAKSLDLERNSLRQNIPIQT
ncbi:hypothetical protein J2X72_003770 [Phyllobacterium sp. 1468]|uniref:hypothetical protein n=1 Tax=Phyllobacterium sp. 1468 TaxID=2817759 RepID=UPI002860D4C6|nr:hypothetical protein [Phyllobacterium sp. 1468]MDR6634958.1 hypothetical protein [Phyllobacterium sp. 1468]